ncbi:hypothetical protein QFZ73_004120 [Peribacillus sp. V2I11]|nr:hypothetical protein [Peribacillus sp. V2I11]
MHCVHFFHEKKKTRIIFWNLKIQKKFTVDLIDIRGYQQGVYVLILNLKQGEEIVNFLLSLTRLMMSG